MMRLSLPVTVDRFSSRVTDRLPFPNKLTVLLVATLRRVGINSMQKEGGENGEKARLLSPPTTSAMKREPAKSSSEHNATNKVHRG